MRFDTSGSVCTVRLLYSILVTCDEFLPSPPSFLKVEKNSLGALLMSVLASLLIAFIHPSFFSSIWCFIILLPKWCNSFLNLL